MVRSSRTRPSWTNWLLLFILMAMLFQIQNIFHHPPPLLPEWQHRMLVVRANGTEKETQESPTFPNSTSHKVGSNGTRPTMVLHLGPSKTGTSFLQCALSGNAYEIIQRDNFLYLGTCSCKIQMNDYEFCKAHDAAAFFVNKTELKPRLVDILSKLEREGRNALIVWEYFDVIHDRSRKMRETQEGRMESLKYALQNWNVHLVIHYRRLYQWLPSLYAQDMTPYCWREWLHAWPGRKDATCPTATGEVVGKPIVPFDMYNTSERKLLPIQLRYRRVIDTLESRNVHPTLATRNLWRKHFPDATIDVVDLHNLSSELGPGNPLLVHLFCIVLQTTNACEAAKQNMIQVLSSESNERYPANYDLLALQAYKEGILTVGNNTVGRQLAREKARDHQETVLNMTDKDFPLRCISNQSLEQLLDLSLAAEQDLFPEHEKQHRADFAKEIQARKFCSIDPQETLKDKNWREFFETLASTSSK